MVQYKVITVAQALDQLKSILEYIIERDSIGKAQIAHDGIIKTIESLKTMPYRNSVYRTVKKTKKTYRFVPQWSYNIIYRIEDDPPVVNVVTIANASQSSKEIEKYLK